MDTPALDALARESSFSGVVRVDLAGETVLAQAYGLAHRAHAIPNSLETQFAIASGVKGLTALVVASLIEEGVLALTTTARSLLGDDLPLIADEVTVEELTTTEDYLRVLDGREPKFAPGTDFSYCNGGYVVLALPAERASGVSF